MHELEMIDGKAQMVFQGDRNAVWHRLGTEIPADLTPQQVMEVAGLDWSVNKMPLTVDYTSPVLGEMKIDTGHSALVRDKDMSVLDVVPSSWNPVQNADAFAFFDEFIARGEMTMDTAGSIRDGRKVWALAKIKEGFTLFGGDEIQGYLLFSNPHYFGRSVDIKVTTVRTVCNNTLNLSLSEKTKDWVRHSHRTQFDASRVKELLGVVSNKMNVLKDQAEYLGSKRYTNETAIEYFQRIFPVLTSKRVSRKEMSTQADRAMEIVEQQPGAEFRPGSQWNLFNAVTYITSNEYGRNDESRLDSVWYGANEQRNQRALKLALEMA
jgi:phage/plasmid-like protein (TIGR03299 family)